MCSRLWLLFDWLHVLKVARNSLTASSYFAGIKAEGSEQETTDKLSWDADAVFHLSEDGTVIITTPHFSAYTCSYCGRKRGPPSLFVVGSGSLVPQAGPEQVVKVIVHVWDERLKLKDLRQVVAAYSLRQKERERGIVIVASGSFLLSITARPCMLQTYEHEWKCVSMSSNTHVCRCTKINILCILFYAHTLLKK